ncbi:hypothetical protein H4R34_003580 [Dimargaris verticillata]|uniref:Uncharacterized protein n=1 Tax=Dimargaris verticillata TaxID=2761393 RepID=A0A9W8B782_9FUNG|nr:hypothetical protein H4R34_003580 [Dimargaris verticillata]
MSPEVHACERALQSAASDLYYISESDSPFEWFFIPADDLERANLSTGSLPDTPAAFASIMYAHEPNANLRHVLAKCANAGQVPLYQPGSDSDDSPGVRDDAISTPSFSYFSTSSASGSGININSSGSDDDFNASTPFHSRIQSIGEFFEPLMDEAASMGQHKQFRELRDRFCLLFGMDPTALSRCCVYRIGQREVGIYAVGIVPGEGIAGLKTLAIET